MALQFDIEPVAENLFQRFKPGAGDTRLPRAQRPVDRAGGAAGQRDQPVIGARQSAERDMRRVAGLGAQKRARAQLHQIGVARLGRGEQHNGRAPGGGRPEFLAEGRAVAEINDQRDTDDRLHPRFGQLFRKFQRAEKIVGVGDRQRRHGVCGGEGGQLADGERAFPERERRMDMQMHEADLADDLVETMTFVFVHSPPCPAARLRARQRPWPPSRSSPKKPPATQAP